MLVGTGGGAVVGAEDTSEPVGDSGVLEEAEEADGGGDTGVLGDAAAAAAAAEAGVGDKAPAGAGAAAEAVEVVCTWGGAGRAALRESGNVAAARDAIRALAARAFEELDAPAFSFFQR